MKYIWWITCCLLNISFLQASDNMDISSTKDEEVLQYRTVTQPGHTITNILSVLDLGSSGAHLGCFKINIDKGIVEEQIFSNKARITLRAQIRDKILPEDVQRQTVDAIKSLLLESRINPKTTKVIGFATAWARAADNSQELINRIKSETGITIKIIDQKTEGEIGHNATLAALRALMLDKQSFFYQIESGQKIGTKRLKLNQNNEKVLRMCQPVISWDIGAGSMQFARENDNHTIDVYGNTEASATFANAVIDLKKEMTNESSEKQEVDRDTPNPLSTVQMNHVIHFAMSKAVKLIDISFVQYIRSNDIMFFGIGILHKNNRLYVNRLLGMNHENFYMKEDLQNAAKILVDKNDSEIAKALGICESEARNRFTSMLLVLGFMKYLIIDKINTLDVTGITGVFFTKGFYDEF